jgi:hypothetical protein
MLSLERAQHMIDIFQKVKDYPSSVKDTIVACYSELGGGAIFGDYCRPARAVERCSAILEKNILDTNPELSHQMFEVIQKLGKLSSENLLEKIPSIALTKTQGGKDKLFIQERLKSRGYIDCGGSFTKLEKADNGFLSTASQKVLRRFLIETNKAPDFVAKRSGTLYVGENKWQFESGGAQSLSIADGVDIFSVINNNPNYRIKRIFCFDGRLDLMLNYISLITEENKIMSIFDVVDYIESGE